MKGIMFIDLETENNPYYGSISSPECPDNYVVMSGWAIDYSPYSGKPEYFYAKSKEESKKWISIPEDVWLLVGHNLSFELDWLYTEQYEELSKFIKRGGRLWCTQLAEYRLSRQQHIYPNLNDTAVRHGGNTKLDAVALEWKMGKLTSEIDSELLRDYLIGTEEMEGDIGNTRIAFYGQWQEASQRGMLKAILEQNNALLYNAVCMSNGLHVDLDIAYKNMEILNNRLEEVNQELYQARLNAGISQEGANSFKMGSDFHKSAWIYGGTYQYDALVPSIDKEGNFRYDKVDVVFDTEDKTKYVEVDPEEDLEFKCTQSGINPNRYKSGKRKGEIKVERIDSDKVKMINGKVKEDLKGIVDLSKYADEFQKDFMGKFTQSRELQDGSSVISTSEDAVLALIQRPETSSEAKQVLSLLREWAILNKIIGAFYDREEFYANGTPKGRSGMLQFVTAKGLIHHSLNMCATKTGRLSSTRPNLQQLPRDDRAGVLPSNIKEMFTSRFGEDGYIVEIDYNALEVRVMADFTGDLKLKEAILNGTDMHSLRASEFHGIPYEDFYRIVKDETHPDNPQYGQWRQDIKSPSFAYQYGASARGIAYATGWSVEASQKFIDTERALFPNVEVFFDNVAEEVEQSKELKRIKLDNGSYDMYYTGYLKAKSGFEYEYRSYRQTVYANGQPYEVDEFKPTEMRNYIIQGDASLFVQVTTGKLIRHYFSVDFYSKKCYPINTVHDQVLLDVHKDVVEEVLKDTLHILQNVGEWMSPLGYELNMPYPVEATAGPNWQEQHSLSDLNINIE